MREIRHTIMGPGPGTILRGLHLGDEDCRETIEDLARLARLTRRVATFAGAAAGAYYFFSYGMAIIGATLLAASLGAGPTWILASVFLGLAMASGLVWLVSMPMWRHLASMGLQPLGSGWRYQLGFAVGFAMAYLIAPLVGEWFYAIAWYPGLGASLALAGALTRGSTHWEYLALAGALILLTSPMVAYLEMARGTGEAAASGLVLLIYLASGSLAMRRAARLFLGEGGGP